MSKQIIVFLEVPEDTEIPNGFAQLYDLVYGLDDGQVEGKMRAILHAPGGVPTTKAMRLLDRQSAYRLGYETAITRLGKARDKLSSISQQLVSPMLLAAHAHLYTPDGKSQMDVDLEQQEELEETHLAFDPVAGESRGTYSGLVGVSSDPAASEEAGYVVRRVVFV